MDKITKRLFISFLIMILVLTGCGNTTAVEGTDSDDASLESSEDGLTGSGQSAPEEGTAAYDCDWNEESFNGVSFWIPSEWECQEADDGKLRSYSDNKSKDFIKFEYYTDTTITGTLREDPVLWRAALEQNDYIWRGSTKGQTIKIGSRVAYKTKGSFYEDDIEYQCQVFYIPVGDYGIVEISFVHASDVEDESDCSCLEMIISNLVTDDSSLPEESKNLGITEIGTLPVTLVDTDDFVVTATELTQDGIRIKIVNNSDEENGIGLDKLSINDYMVDGKFYYDLDGDQTKSKYCWVKAGEEKTVLLTADNLEDFNITDIGKVGMMFECVNREYDDFYKSDYVIIYTKEDYKAEDYETYVMPEEIVYQDDNVIIAYEGITDGTAYFSIKNLKKEMLDVYGNKLSLDGEFYDTYASITAYPETICRMEISKVEVTTGMEMVISFSIIVNGSHYSTDNCSVNL